MAFVILILLLKVGQRTPTGRVPVRGAPHVRTNRGLDLFGLPPVGLQIVSTHHDILTRPSPRYGRGLDLFGLPPVGLQIVSTHHDILTRPSPRYGRIESDFGPPNDGARWSRS
jgi:hypothetical protein